MEGRNAVRSHGTAVSKQTKQLSRESNVSICMSHQFTEYITKHFLSNIFVADKEEASEKTTAGKYNLLNIIIGYEILICFYRQNKKLYLRLQNIETRRKI